MNKLLTLICFLALLPGLTANASDQGNTAANPRAILHTSAGDITLELFQDKAPVSVANFLNYARSGFYSGTLFHRVVKRFVVQGGGFTKELVKKQTNKPIVNESGNGLHNDRWTVAMARLPDPDSATSQFFINLRMNSSLDSQRGHPGYAVFAEVIDGKHVVSAIGRSPVRPMAGMQELPVEPIWIESVEVIE